MEFFKEHIVLIIVLLILFILILIRNAMIKKRNKVKTAFSSLDVMLKKRYDVMPNLASMVKKYMAHESELLTKLTELRTKAQETKDIDESIELNNEIDGMMKKVNLSIENYPDLKSNQNLLHMQATLNEIEEQISAARRTYNAHVEAYNTFIEMVPMNILAFVLKFKKFKQFEISNEERTNKIWM